MGGVTGRDHVEHSLSEASGPSLSLSRTGLTGPSLLRLGLRIILAITLLQAGTDSYEVPTGGKSHVSPRGRPGRGRDKAPGVPVGS